MIQWTELARKVDFIEGRKNLVPERYMGAFENKYDMSLPQDYKCFFQIFGSGVVGQYWRLPYPGKQMLKYSKLLLERLGARVSPHKCIRNTNLKLVDLLENGLVFASNDQTVLAIWDLDSYNKLDNNYDIYLVDYEAYNYYKRLGYVEGYSGDVRELEQLSQTEYSHYLGRSFYAFISTILFGEGLSSRLTRKGQELFDEPNASFLPLKNVYGNKDSAMSRFLEFFYKQYLCL